MSRQTRSKIHKQDGATETAGMLFPHALCLRPTFKVQARVCSENWAEVNCDRCLDMAPEGAIPCIESCRGYCRMCNGQARQA